jgi:cytoskeletal protein CcmA (bactofilin family)
MPGAHIEGDVINQTLSIENGAHVDGKIRRVEDPLSEPIEQTGGYGGWGQSYAGYDQPQYSQPENVYSLPGTDSAGTGEDYAAPARKPKAAE